MSSGLRAPPAPRREPEPPERPAPGLPPPERPTAELPREPPPEPRASPAPTPPTARSTPKGAPSSDALSGAEGPEAQRAAKRQAIELHMRALEHASRCDGVGCKRLSCAKMRGYLAHSAACAAPRGECLDCKRVATLVLLHVRGCSDERCVVPGCRARKEQLLVDQWRSALEG